MKGTIGKVINTLVVTIIVVIAAALALSAFPIPGNFQLRVVRSGSMEPAIHTGSVVFVRPAAVYNVNDVITFDNGFTGPKGERIPVSHRVVSAREDGGTTFYKVKGDANKEPDPKEVRKDQVLGKVQLSLPYAGYVIQTARMPWGFFALIVLPALVIAYDEIVKIIAEVKRMRATTRKASMANSKSNDI